VYASYGQTLTYPGSRWIEALSDILYRADAIILVGTPGAFASDWVLNEVGLFFSRGGRVLPIGFQDGGGTLDKVPIFLRSIHWLLEDASTLRKGPSQEALASLVKSLNWIRSEARRSSPQETLARTHPQKHPLNEGKLILVGRGEVGKTSLVKRLVANDFDGDESKTQGIKITSWFLTHDAHTFRLNIWDFGGQEIMHATHQFFLTERSRSIGAQRPRGRGRHRRRVLAEAH
jgi:hypothetical protein